jgi:hypothetical protein
MLMVGVRLPRRHRFAMGRHSAPRNASGAARVAGVRIARIASWREDEDLQMTTAHRA